MAEASMTEEVVFTLKLSKREAEALCEVLIRVESEGEGPVLDEVYRALCHAGAESIQTSSKGEVTVWRSSK